MRITISQPGLFPWWGTFAKAQASDLMIHLDHVTWQKGGYLNRYFVQPPTRGRVWCTLPLQRPAFGTPINEVSLQPHPGSVAQHCARLGNLLGPDGVGAKAVTDLLTATLGAGHHTDASDLAVASTELVASRAAPNCRFLRSSDMAPQGRSTAMLLDLLTTVGADEYVFGPGRSGRQSYLDVPLLQRAGIRVGLARYGERLRCSALQDLWVGESITAQLPMGIEWLT